MKVRKEVAETLEDEFDDVRYDYSGRGMFGATCLGIVQSDYDSSVALLLDQMREVYADDEGGEAFIELLDAMLEREPNTDSMAFDTIYYWPGIEVE